MDIHCVHIHKKRELFFLPDRDGAKRPAAENRLYALGGSGTAKTPRRALTGPSEATEGRYATPRKGIGGRQRGSWRL